MYAHVYFVPLLQPPGILSSWQKNQYKMQIGEFPASAKKLGIIDSSNRQSLQALFNTFSSLSVYRHSFLCLTYHQCSGINAETLCFTFNDVI